MQRAGILPSRYRRRGRNRERGTLEPVEQSARGGKFRACVLSKTSGCRIGKTRQCFLRESRLSRLGAVYPLGISETQHPFIRNRQRRDRSESRGHFASKTWGDFLGEIYSTRISEDPWRFLRDTGRSRNWKIRGTGWREAQRPQFPESKCRRF